MSQEIITFNMISKEVNYCIATLNGVEVKIDPYVGCVWSPSHFERGGATFDGHWWTSMDGEERVFLPRRQIFPEDLCANCGTILSKESDKLDEQ